MSSHYRRLGFIVSVMLVCALAAACSAGEGADSDAPRVGSAEREVPTGEEIDVMDREQAGPVDYAGELDGDAVHLRLETVRSGPTSGSLQGLGAALFLTGTLAGGRLEGQLSSGGMRVPVRGELSGDTLHLSIGPDEDGEVLQTVLRRDGGRAASSAPVTSAPTINVVVNGESVTQATRQGLEQQYGLRMVEGRYWYDATSGAWGLEGGPTKGYLMPGMPLGGPLRMDASGGGTAVVVNGRALHPYDLMSLQMLVGAVNPGRYFLDARGNMGFEGGPPLVNLVALLQVFAANQQQARLYGPGWGGGNASGGGGGGGGGGGWYSGITGAGGNESGGSGYVMGEGWSVSY